MAADDMEGQMALAEYIMRNAFSEQKITYEDHIYRGYRQSALSLRHDPWRQQEKLRDLHRRGIHRRHHSAHSRQEFSDGQGTMDGYPPPSRLMETASGSLREESHGTTRSTHPAVRFPGIWR